MKKRIHVPAMLFALLLLLAAGCGQRKQVAPEEPPQVLRLLALSTVEDFLEQAVEEFNSGNSYGVTVELEVLDMDNYKRMLPVYAAGGDMPDLFFTWEAGYLEPYVSSGNVLALTDDLSDWEDRFAPGVFEPLTFEGEIYAVPLQQSLTVVFYNKAVFREIGAEPPETWEAFLQLCRTLKDRGTVPVAIGAEDWQAGQPLTALLAGVGGRTLYESLDEGGAWRQEEMERCVCLLKELHDLGYVSRAGTASILDGTAAMRLTGDWLQAGYRENGKIGVFLLPAVEEANRGTCICSVDQCYAVSSGCRNPEAACAFLRLLTGRENQLWLQQQTGQVCSTRDVAGDETYPLQEEVRSLYGQVEERVIWIDRGIGGDVGTMFNQMAVAILSGRDPVAELEQFYTALEALYNHTGGGAENGKG